MIRRKFFHYGLISGIATMFGGGCGHVAAESRLAAQTETGQLITCAVADMYDCTFATPYLVAQTFPQEMVFQIEYTFSCGAEGHPQDYFVGFLSESDGIFTEMRRFGRDGGRRVLMEVRGKGPIRIHDSDPRWSRQNPKYERDCIVGVHREVSRDIGPGTQERVRTLVRDVLPSQVGMYSSAKASRELLAGIQTAVTKLDLSVLKTILSSLRTNLRGLVGHDETVAIDREIDLLMVLNPALDPQETVDEEIARALPLVHGHLDQLVKSTGKQLAETLSILDAALVFASPQSLPAERERVQAVKREMVDL